MLNAQVNEGKYSLSLGDQNGFMMDHKSAEKQVVEEVIENNLKPYGKIKRNRKAGEWNCQECNLSMVSSNTLNVYYRIEEGRDLVTSYLYFDDGTKFISSENDSDASEQIKMICMDIYYEVKREMIRKDLEEMEKQLKDYEKDLGKLEKKNKDLHQDIEEYKEKIRKSEKDIEQNLRDQEDKNMEIEQQKRLLSKTTDKLNKVGRSS